MPAAPGNQPGRIGLSGWPSCAQGYGPTLAPEHQDQADGSRPGAPAWTAVSPPTPLLFTSMGNLDWSLAMNQPMASLPVTIYQYAGSAFDDWVRLAWVGALLITLGVLALNIVARVVLHRGK